MWNKKNNRKSILRCLLFTTITKFSLSSSFPTSSSRCFRLFLHLLHVSLPSSTTWPPSNDLCVGRRRLFCTWRRVHKTTAEGRRGPIWAEWRGRKRERVHDRFGRPMTAAVFCVCLQTVKYARRFLAFLPAQFAQAIFLLFRTSPKPFYRFDSPKFSLQPCFSILSTLICDSSLSNVCCVLPIKPASFARSLPMMSSCFETLHSLTKSARNARKIRNKPV